MAYRMHEITERVRVGINSAGELNLEVYDRDYRNQQAEVTEVYIPGDALDGLFDFLRRHT